MNNILSNIRQHALAQRVALCALLPAMVVMPDQVRANPSGGVVVHGAAEINADIEGHLQIFQTSNKAIINWEDFSIGEGELTQFIQPGANASALSRVISGNPSAIMGTLQANGGHMLINQNGIVVGANGVVDVAGMNVLSTMDVSNDQFLAGGDMVFTGATAAGVTNFGTISSSEGDVILLGNFVDNQGSIGAVNGTVALGAGGSILLSSGGGESTISIQGAGAGGNTGISNSGSITAAAAELKAHGNVYALAVNNTGTIRATGVNRANGRVVLSAGEPGGSIVNTGSIRANNADGSGGIIEINAGPEGSVDLQAGEVVANGGSGAGGTISVTGMTVNVGEGVQVTANGDTGGSVTVGSGDFTTAVTTEANSVISANGAGGQGGTVAILGTADSVMTLGGRASADGADGGSVTVTGGNITQTETGVFSANGENNGGVISVNGSEIVLSGLNEVNGVNGNGGAFQANATENLTVTETGVINANGGENGGMISLGAEGDLQFNGNANANGENGNGGLIEATADGDLSVGPTGVLNANGGEAGGTINMSAGADLTFDGAASANGINGEGGRILADAGGTNTINGTLSVTSENGIGGRIGATGEEVFVGPNAVLDASGALGGGAIFAGGDFQGAEGGLREAQKTTVAAGAQFRANSTVGGNGGTVVVWADGDTFFEGAITAQALGATGNGGLIEVSGAETLTFRGDVSATSVGGMSGTVLFDPGDVSVGDGSSDVPIENVNTILQGGTSVIIATEDGSITFENLGLGNDRDIAIQWTNSDASFGAFASDNIFVYNHIRTSGGGSINLIAGWGGQESDFGTGASVTSYFGDEAAPPDPNNPAGDGLFESISGLSDVEAVWESYLEQGLFGDNGTVFIGASDLNRSVNVGSRFGNTNVAASNLIMTTIQDSDGGEDDWVHLGFRDTGTVFALRSTHGYHNQTIDLNDRTLEVDNDVLVGMLPLLADGTLDLSSPLLVDLNNDTVPDGVYAVNSNGILDADNIATGGLADGSDAGDATFIPFATNFGDARYGNWWWQQIDGRAPDPQGLGGILPEHGAGTSVTDRADINVATTGAVLINSGGRHQNYAQIGHGGDSTAWGDDKGLRNTDSSINGTSNQVSRNFIFNNSTEERTGNSIARLAGIYGNINVLAGLDPSTVQYDRNALTGNLSGTVSSQGGLVRLEGWQNTASTNNINNPDQSNSSEAYVQIGHLGSGQFGSVTGDITVRAGGDVDVLAGAHNSGHASIGHTMNGSAYWNPSSDPAQQVRIFANSGDLDNPNLRKGELFQNTNTGVGPGRGFYSTGHDAGTFDDDFLGTSASVGLAGQHPDGVIGVRAMTGVVRTDLVGDIIVESGGANGVTVKGFSNPDTRTVTNSDDLSTIGDLDGDGVSALLDGTDDNDDRDGLIINRDRRFAMIGHGGSNDDVWQENNTDLVRLRVNPGDETDSGTSQLMGDGGTRVSRSRGYVNIQGDITVTASRGGVTLQAGNDTHDFAAIGHGGAEVGDYETGGAIVGDIAVTAAGDVLLEGGAVQADFTGNDDRDFYSYASIGHHGRETGIQYYAGDITVIADGDVTLRGGRYRGSGAKIGHQSESGYGQVSGEFTRNEQFVIGDALGANEGQTVLSESVVTATETTFRVDLNGDGDYTDPDEVKTFSHSGFTSNVTVEAGANGNSGDILLTHADPGGLLNQNQYANNNDGNRNEVNYSNVHIGHGGRETAAFYSSSAGGNTGYNYSAKIGDVNVTAGGVAVTDATTGAITTTGGNITLQNGEGEQGWWTTIGHALGNSGRDRANGPDTLDFSYVMAGNININAFGNLMLDATFANETDTTNVNGPGLPQVVGAPADQNHVQIGHGGGYDGLDVVVLDTGDFKGITLSSDIDVEVGNNLDIKGGNGSIDSHAQIGHGYTSNTGNDPARPVGFSGDITVNVGNSMTLTGSPNAAVQLPGLTSEALPVEGAAAVVGHGGHQLDADLSGDISVYVGNRTIYNGDEADFVGNLTLQGSQRMEVTGTNGNPLTDTSSDPLGSAYNFAKIGHWATELEGNAGRGAVSGNAAGDITVVVANDLFMNGGTTPDYAAAPIVFAFAQIGNGGPGVSGTKSGNITVLVGNDFTTVDGTSQENTPGAINSNNYVMVGNGDWVRDGSTFVLPSTGGQGARSGDIRVAVGHSATLDHTLIGHADPDVMTGATTILGGNTYFGISRDFPFYGDNPSFTSDGSLTTDNDTVFSSGFYGGGTELRIYMPQREDNNINDTRLNSATSSYNLSDTDASFADSKGSIFDASQGELAGRGDEIYLKPDLFWDDEGISSLANSDTFPETLADAGTGGIATVNDPGGFPNLVSLTADTFGTGTVNNYRGANAVVGTGQYTFYYDAIQPVASFVAAPVAPSGGGGGTPAVVPPVIFVPTIDVEEPVPVVVTPFNFLPFLFIDKFDSFDRSNLGLGDLQGGSVFDGLGILGFFTDRDEEEGLKDGDPISRLLGFNDDDEEATVGDTEEERRRNTRNRLIGKIGNIYYVYDVNAGEYSSFREFGLPASLLIE